MAKQDDYIKTQVRLPSDLHARIQLAAEKTGRSMNAEILSRLEWSFTAGIPAFDFLEAVEGMDKEAKRLGLPLKVIIDVSGGK